ncbi:putative reverse transcriptase domain-containing protein [Tanacetum coccineum]
MERDEVMAEGGDGRRRDDGVNGDGDDGVAAAEVANGEAADLAWMVGIWPKVGGAAAVEGGRWLENGQIPPEIPEWKWENITMDFIMKLLRTSNRHDAIWVIVDRLTKSAHFLAICEDYKTERLARLYIDEIKTLGTQLDLSTAYHPQTDGKSECTIQTLEDMLEPVQWILVETVTPPNLGGSGILNIRGRYFIDQ